MRLLLALLSFVLLLSAQSESRVDRGNEYLNHGLVDAAQTECEAAFKAKTSDVDTAACLDRINAFPDRSNSGSG